MNRLCFIYLFRSVYFTFPFAEPIISIRIFCLIRFKVPTIFFLFIHFIAFVSQRKGRWDTIRGGILLVRDFGKRKRISKIGQWNDWTQKYTMCSVEKLCVHLKFFIVDFCNIFSPAPYTKFRNKLFCTKKRKRKQLKIAKEQIFSNVLIKGTSY